MGRGAVGRLMLKEGAVNKIDIRRSTIHSRSTVLIVSNPESGSHDAALLGGLATAYGAHGFAVRFGESSPHDKPDLSQHFDRLCIAAGDGTIRHVLAQMAGTDKQVPVDFYPAGTINLAARERDMLRNPSHFVTASLKREARPLYLASLNDTHFVVCASVSPDARAVAAVSPELKKKIGRFAYVVAMIKMLAHWQRPALSIAIDDSPYFAEAVYVAKGRFYAGPWSFAPEARIDVPLLHVVMLKQARRRDFVAFILATLTGRANRLSNVQIVTGKRVNITANSAQLVQADGDIASALPAEIAIMPGSLSA